MSYGDPLVDKKLLGLIDEIVKCEQEGNFSKAILKTDELITSLESFHIATNDIDLKRIYASEMRDRRLLRRILEMKEKLAEFELLLVDLEERIESLENFKREFESQK